MWGSINSEDDPMATEMHPGSNILITLTKSPTNAAAAKTLSRLFSRGDANRRARAKRKRMLQDAVRTKIRGGRPWAIRPRVPDSTPTPGESCTVLATPQVLRDLGRLGRFVKIEPSK